MILLRRLPTAALTFSALGVAIACGGSEESTATGGSSGLAAGGNSDTAGSDFIALLAFIRYVLV